MPGYTYLSLGSARSILAGRLQDSGLVYYSGGNGAGSAVELNQYIVQAVRAWQAYTSSYRQRAVFNTSAGVPFYDLNTVLAPACMARTVTDREIVTLVLAQLLEPPLAAGWTGSGMFTFSAIMAAIQARLNRFLGDTGVECNELILPAGVAPPVDRINLPDTVLDVRRAAWVSSTGTALTWDQIPDLWDDIPGLWDDIGQTSYGVSTLWRDDQWAMQAFQPGGLQSPTDPPVVYGLATLPPSSLQVFPPPASPGLLDLLVVSTGAQVGTTPAAVFGSPVTLNLPDCLAWAVAFGAMSDLLSNDSPARDPARAAYCEARYQEAVGLAKMPPSPSPSVMLTAVNGVPIWTGSVFEMDAFLASWQVTQGQPGFGGMCGRNLMGFGPVPDDVYGISADVVSNIPVPAADGDFLQVDRGSLDAVIDYAQHLASFKLGGAEFAASEGLYKNFLAAAGVENGRLKNQAFYQQAMLGTVGRQAAEVVRV